MSRLRSLGARVIAAAALLVSGIAGADASLRDKARIEPALKPAPPCCVIDARATDSQNRIPLPDATLYREGMTIDPIGPVVVVADTDARALQVGRMLEGKTKERPVLAVKGGIATWQSVVIPEPGTALPESFVIPSDTCQNAPPLQTLPFDQP